MGNNCIKDKENQFLKLKGEYPLMNPQKQHSLEQFTYNMKLNLDSFEEEFFQKEYKFNSHVQEESSRTQQQDSIDFVIESPTFRTLNLKNYLVFRNNSAPVQKANKFPYVSINHSKYIVYNIPEHSNHKKIKPNIPKFINNQIQIRINNIRSLSGNKQLCFVQKVEGHKPRKHNTNISNNNINNLGSKSITWQCIDMGKSNKIGSWKFSDPVKILF